MKLSVEELPFSKKVVGSKLLYPLPMIPINNCQLIPAIIKPNTIAIPFVPQPISPFNVQN
jgi:hypothetical protein